MKWVLLILALAGFGSREDRYATFCVEQER